ncbi:KH domain-containing protein [Candidatus Daviesbacteria bacterium]|nr:KH domain-containing protein [Candidatus Daviesbacteria bacterium]
MENQLSEVLDNILGLLLLEGSYDIEEDEEFIKVSVETPDAGRLIGAKGESLDSLQLLVNQIMTRKLGKQEEFKRIVFDVGGWRKQKEEDLNQRGKEWAQAVLDSGKEMELEPQAAWQRRIIHEAAGQIEGIETESLGEGRDRHIVIKLKTQMSNVKTEDKKGKRGKAKVKKKKDQNAEDAETEES